MPSHPWNADASVFKYPPLNASGAGDPVVTFAGSLRDCLQFVANLDETDRSNIEIETAEGAELYNDVDIERMIAANEHQ